MESVFNLAKEKMEKSINSLKYEYNSIRAGRANAAILDKISVDYYGSPTPINQMAAISVPEARVLAIQPWDMSALGLIEKAILASDTFRSIASAVICALVGIIVGFIILLIINAFALLGYSFT